jgi:CRP-like cAMP-binding protein
MFVDMARQQRKKLGTFLFREGDPVTKVFIVARGEIKISKMISKTKPTYLE